MMDKPLKIGIVSPYDYSAFGGVNDHISNLAEQYKISGHTVKILAPNSNRATSNPDLISLGGVIPIPSGGAIAKVSLSIWLRARIKSILEASSKNPTWISDTATALSAIEKMNSKKITSLLVARNQDINKKIKNVIGVIHLHHCLSQGIK